MLPHGRYGTFNTLKRCAWTVRVFWSPGQQILIIFVGVIFFEDLLIFFIYQINIDPPQITSHLPFQEAGGPI